MLSPWPTKQLDGARLQVSLVLLSQLWFMIYVVSALSSLIYIDLRANMGTTHYLHYRAY